MKLINWLLENHRGERMLRKFGDALANFRLERFLMRAAMALVTMVTAHVTTSFYSPELTVLVLMIFGVTLMIFLTNEDEGHDEEESRRDSKASER